MIIKKVSQVKKTPVTGDGVEGVQMQILLGPDDQAPNFIMRRFSIAPGGYTYYHTHNFEHEVFVLAGSGKVRRENDEIAISANMVVLVQPNEVHQFINAGQDDLVFLCIIPK